MLHQALRDVAQWVEKGTPPPASTSYHIDDGQVSVPATAAERKGIQPVVTLRTNGAERVEVKAGRSVTLQGTIEVPAGAGSIIAAEWDFDGRGSFPEHSTVPEDAKSLTVSVTHRFDTPGTYFSTLRGVSQRQGDRNTPYARIENLGRMRVVVTGNEAGGK